MQIKKNTRTMPLRRSASDTSRNSVSQRFYKRLYCAVVLLVVYSSCIYFSVERGLSRTLSAHQSMIRKPSSYVTQQLELSDQPRINNPVVDSSSTAVVAPPNSVETKRPPALVGDHQHPAPTTKPRLFLHVGPQKTGSSTLQSMLDRLAHLTESLPGDNLYWRHIMPENGDFDCEMDKWGGWHNCVASEKLEALIDSAKKDGANLLLTDENLGQDFVNGLREAIDDEDWDVTVIVMYRQIHEWLISWYNQIHKTTNTDSEGNVLFNEEGIPYRTEHTQWPDHGGVHVPSFREFYEKYTLNWEPSELAEKHRSIEYYNLYTKSFDNVLFYNMHQGGSMVMNLICNIFGASHACAIIQSNEIEIEKVNSSVNLDLDILSVYAYEKGLVSKSLSRQKVLEAVTNHVHDSDKILPRNCDLEMIEQIREWLVDTEKIMVGEAEWSNAKESELLELFNTYVAKGKMCDVDVDAVLADEDWVHFFQSLGDHQKGYLVVNVGPIGSNAIHDALTTLSGASEALQKDSFKMAELDNLESYFDCTPQTCEALGQFRSMLSSLEGTGTNILISNDSLDERYVEAFKHVVDAGKWNVKVVVGHIRLDQFLLTMYENEYRSENLEPTDKKFYSKWPDHGGSHIPDFNQWINAFAEDFDAQNIQELLGMHLRDAYASSFKDVDYSAYYPQTDVMVTKFVCQILPGATNTCNLVKAEMKTESLLDDFVEADILAVGAHERGLVGTQVSRDALREAIHKKLLAGKKTLSRICVAAVTKQLYDWMILNEHTMLGNRLFATKRIALINQDFQELLQSGKLCAVDVEKELSGETWVSFFRDTPGFEQVPQ